MIFFFIIFELMYMFCKIIHSEAKHSTIPLQRALRISYLKTHPGQAVHESSAHLYAQGVLLNREP